MDAADYPPPPPIFGPIEIRQLRVANGASLTLFAERLNISASTARRWEAGTMKPGGMARRLLAVVQKHGLDLLA